MINFLLKIFVGIKLFLTHPLVCFGLAEKPKMNKLEEKIINSLILHLNEDVRESLKQQLNEINFIERVFSPKTIVSFNKISGFVYSSERSVKIFDECDECILAKVDFSFNKSRIRAIFYIVRGNFFSIEFTQNIEIFKDEDVVIDSVIVTNI